jgi:hypothetical protein
VITARQCLLLNHPARLHRVALGCLPAHLVGACASAVLAQGRAVEIINGAAGEQPFMFALVRGDEEAA